MKTFRIFKWFVVGLITFLSDTILFLLLFKISHTAGFSNILSNLVALTLNYKLHHSWSFKSKNSHKNALPVYLIILLLNISLNTIIVINLLDLINNGFFAKFFSAILVAPLNYLQLKYFAFKSK